MTEQRKKKAIKYHFIDMNDPNRYKKLKVTRACDFCRKRKSKCDLGIPGSGTCSNCKKAKNMCVFSSIPTSTKSNSNSFTNLKSKTSSSTSILQLNGNASIITENDFSDLFQYSSTNIQYDFSNLYQTQNPLFSLDCKGRCNYEKHSSNTYIHSHVSSLDHITSTIDEIPSYSKQTEYELFHTFFNYVHPFYPILDSFQILQSLQCDSKPIPNALKWAIMAIALHFTQHYQKGSSATLATIYYHQAYLLLDHSSPSLSSLQTLLLLYKFEELMTPVGASLSTVALSYLYKALDMLKNLLQEQTGLTDMWTIKDEFICRNGWILFIIITTSSNADERWRELLEDCPTPSRLPSLIEREHYNKGEFDTACNLIHLINITLLYSRVIRFIFDQSTLFAKDTANYLLEFNKFATSLDVWRASASKHLSLSLVDNPSMPYSAQVHSNTNNDGILHHSISKTAFFTAYLCLIHDILDVLISIHCATSNSYLFDDLPRKITQVCCRAHSLTVHGKIEESHFFRLASIQGSRLIAFGLTLSIQVHIYFQEQKGETKILDDVKKFHTSCILSLQIFETMTLTPQFCIAIQTLQTQIKANECLYMLTTTTVHHQRSLSNDSTGKSISTMSIPNSSSGHLSTDSSQSKGYGYFNLPTRNSAVINEETNHPTLCYSSTETDHTSNEKQLLDQLSSANVTSINYYCHQQEKTVWPQRHQRDSWSQYQPLKHDTIDDNMSKISSLKKQYITQQQEPVTPPSINIIPDSYFQYHHSSVAVATAVNFPFDSLNLTLPILNSKSCKNKNKILI